MSAARPPLLEPLPASTITGPPPPPHAASGSSALGHAPPGYGPNDWGGPPNPASPYRHLPPLPAFRARPAPRLASTRELLAAVAVVGVVDAALYDAAGGLGLALLFSALPLLTFAVARGRRVSPSTVAIGGMLAAVAARCAFAPTVPAVLAGGALALALGASLHLRASLFDVAITAPRAISASTVGVFYRGGARALERIRIDRATVVPIVVPLALVSLFALVFAAANPVVARALSAVADAVSRHVDLPSAPRVALAVFSALGATALLRPRIARRAWTRAAEVKGEATIVSRRAARNALVGLNALFLMENAIDASALWAGRPPAGVDLQAYAHQGTAWLTVALLLTTVVLGLMFRGALAHDPLAKTVRTLAYAWVGQGLVLALGTYRRISMHIASSGLSDLRIVGILGTSLVVVGLVLVAYKLRHGLTFSWLLRRQFDAFVVAWMAWAILPTHLLSARVDVARIQAGELGALVHVPELAREAEAAPALLPLLDHPDARVREGIAATLLDARSRLAGKEEGRKTWAARDLGTRRALAALDAHDADIRRALDGAAPNAARATLFQLSGAVNYGTEADVRAVTAAERGKY